MAEPVLMPQVGQDIETATIVEWVKKEGEAVNKGDVIAVVESDKAAFEVEAYGSGVLLKILHCEGEEVKVLTPIAYIGHSGEELEKPEEAVPQKQREEPSVGASSAQITSAEGGVAASPSARRLASEKGISLDAVVGTGPGGRITKKDILAAALADSVTQDKVRDEDVIVPFSPMRTRIAQRLVRSKQTIPHFYLFMDVDMSQAVARRIQYNQKNNAKITITDMIIKAVALALAEFRKFNALVNVNKVILKRNINIGVAISVEDGLIVPVISDAEKKNIDEISVISRENADGARAGRLKPSASGTFTISNLGMYSVDGFLPIINPPECAILAVGTVSKKPAVTDDIVTVRKMMTMSLACDHRVVDGTYAARFLEKIKYYLENPNLLEG